MNHDPENAWEQTMRESFGKALAAFMDYASAMYRNSIQECDRLKTRNVYLEQRVKELEERKP